MKVKVIRGFFDIEERCNREEGATFECTQERFDAINGTPNGKLVKRVASPKRKVEGEQQETEEQAAGTAEG